MLSVRVSFDSPILTWSVGLVNWRFKLVGINGWKSNEKGITVQLTLFDWQVLSGKQKQQSALSGRTQKQKQQQNTSCLTSNYSISQWNQAVAVVCRSQIFSCVLKSHIWDNCCNYKWTNLPGEMRVSAFGNAGPRIHIVTTKISLDYSQKKLHRWNIFACTTIHQKLVHFIHTWWCIMVY